MREKIEEDQATLLRVGDSAGPRIRNPNDKLKGEIKEGRTHTRAEGRPRRVPESAEEEEELSKGTAPIGDQGQ